MPEQSLLYNALKQMSKDIRVLIDLSEQVTEESWEKMVDTVKKEIHDEVLLRDDKEDSGKGLVYRSLIIEIYDHLNILISSIKKSHDRLRRLATRDLLTGLYNRNYFNETVVRDIQKARRYGEKLSFIIIDIDNFKIINDEYGHLHGDGVIKACADLLKKSVRKSDFLCRYGGDEFVIVTPMSACEANEPLYGRIQELLDEWNSEYSTFEYSLSISMGCSVWQDGMDVMDVLHEADMNMYLMKEKKKSM